MSSLLFVRIIVLLASAAICKTGLSWGTGTHLYIAEKYNGTISRSLLPHLHYGAICPDVKIGMQAVDPGYVSLFNLLTHESGYLRLLPFVTGNPSLTAFAKGWVTHQEIGGADRYAHLVSPPGMSLAGMGYVNYKCTQLTSVPVMTDFYIEVAVDLLVRNNLDRQLANKLANAVNKRSADIPNILGLAYGADIPTSLITQAESVYRSNVKNYAAAMALPSPLNKTAMATAMTYAISSLSGQSVSASNSLKYLNAAINICAADYRTAIESTIRNIRY